MKLASLEEIVRAFDQHHVRYLIVGGLAAVAHGVNRLTVDADLVIQLQPDNVRNAMTALGSLGYRPKAPVSMMDFADPEIRKRWIEEKNIVVFGLYSDRHRDTPVDVFITEPFDFDQEYNAALSGEIAPGLRARFIRIDTLIAMKESAHREKDLEDIRQLNLLKGSPNGRT